MKQVKPLNVGQNIYNIGIFVGRMSLPMEHHFDAIRYSLRKGLDRVVIVLGSPYQYPDVKNPFTLRERIDMIQTRIHKDLELRGRVVVTYAEDSKSEMWWRDNVRNAVDYQRDLIALSQPEDTKFQYFICACNKDKSSYWNTAFKGYNHIDIPIIFKDDKPISATSLRGHIIGAVDADEAYEQLQLAIDSGKIDVDVAGIIDQILFSEPQGSERFIRLNNEYKAYERELQKFESYPYRDCLHHCCSDSLVVCDGHVLLVQRANHPSIGAWAMAGGHKENGETFEDCAIRELKEEINLRLSSDTLRRAIRDRKVFDEAGRDPVFDKPTVVHYTEIERDPDGRLPRANGKDETLCAEWKTIQWIENNKHLIFADHYEIMRTFF